MALTPSHVKPSSSASYTVTLTNSASSDPKGADRATISVDSFQVVGQPTSSVTGCGSSTSWTAEVALDGHTITLRRTGPGANNLCPGGTLTVVFTAGSPASEGSYVWPTALAHGAETFTGGPSPTVIVDGTPPETAIDSGPPLLTNQTGASFTFSSEAGTTFGCRLDGGSFSPCTSPKGYGGLAAGPHIFEARATDLAGNTDATAASHAWTVDLAPPNTSIDSGPPSRTNQTSASFAFSSEVGATFECSLDGGAFSACTSPGSYGDLSEGQHTFQVRAIDSAGNVDVSPASRTWTVDLTPPDTTIQSGPPSSTNSTTASFAFSSEAGATFECSLDGGAFSPCTSPKSYSGLPEGPRTFAVRAKDLAGNTDPVPASRQWTIDLIGPPTTILTAPPNATNATSASFTFSSEAGTTFECSLDGALFSACTTPNAYTNLVDGPHVFAVRAVDPAKNTGSASAHGWTIDSRPPTAAFAAGPSALSNSRSATFAFSTDEASAVECRLDAGGFQPCSSPASYPGLVDGTHTFWVRPTDAVGNVGNVASYAWTIDATAPETTLSSRPRSTTTVVSATFTFSASEPVSFECRLDGSAFSPCSSPKRYAGLRRGRQHNFAVRSIDAAGNVDATPAAHRWAIGAAPRTVKRTSALTAPLPGARVSSPPLLRWRPVTRASYYNVQLFRGRVKVFSAWPRRPSLRLRSRWTYLGKERKLSPGVYRWFVWPAYSGGRYGRVLGQSTFIVTAA